MQDKKLYLSLFIGFIFFLSPEIASANTVNIDGDGAIKVGKVLGLLAVLAILLETALSTLFHWRWFSRWFDGRGLKLPIAVGVSWLFIDSMNLDSISQLLSAYDNTLSSQNTPLGQFVTALIVAGGSKTVFDLFEKVGVRNPFQTKENTAAVRNTPRVQVSVDRGDRIEPNKPIQVLMDGVIIGSISERCNELSWPNRSLPITIGSRVIRLSGVGVDGAEVFSEQRVNVGVGVTANLRFQL